MYGNEKDVGEAGRASGLDRGDVFENFELFDFEIGFDDVDEIPALDRGEGGRTGPNPDTFACVPG